MLSRGSLPDGEAVLFDRETWRWQIGVQWVGLHRRGWYRSISGDFRETRSFVITGLCSWKDRDSSTYLRGGPTNGTCRSSPDSAAPNLRLWIDDNGQRNWTSGKLRRFSYGHCDHYAPLCSLDRLFRPWTTPLIKLSLPSYLPIFIRQRSRVALS